IAMKNAPIGLLLCFLLPQALSENETCSTKHRILQTSKHVIFKLCDTPKLSKTDLEQLGLQILEHLTLSNCVIEEISNDAFEMLENLEELHLSHNALSSLPQDLFKSNKKLRKISLDNNKFEVVPDIDIIHLQLEILDLSHNKISSVGHIQSPNVEILDLSNNFLKYLFEGHIANFKNVKKLILTKNKWESASADETERKGAEKLNAGSIYFTCVGKKENMFKYVPILENHQKNVELFSSTSPPNNIESLQQAENEGSTKSMEQFSSTSPLDETQQSQETTENKKSSKNLVAPPNYQNKLLPLITLLLLFIKEF
ncbi:hypothetical protein L9F63_014372, partial [Diploptera punctata]